MKKDYMGIDIQLFQWEAEDVVTLSAGAFDNLQSGDLYKDDIFND